MGAAISLLVPLGYIFGLPLSPLYFHTCFLYFDLWVVAKVLPFLLPPFSFGCFIPNKILYTHYTPTYFRIRKTKHFSRGPSCVLSLSGPDPSQVCSGCVCSEVGGVISSVPLEIRVAGSG